MIIKEAIAFQQSNDVMLLTDPFLNLYGRRGKRLCGHKRTRGQAGCYKDDLEAIIFEQLLLAFVLSMVML